MAKLAGRVLGSLPYLVTVKTENAGVYCRYIPVSQNQFCWYLSAWTVTCIYVTVHAKRYHKCWSFIVATIATGM